jgi:hypothetical protein
MYIHEDLKNISIFTFSKKHTEMFMMKNRNNGITATNSITPHSSGGINFLTLKK